MNDGAALPLRQLAAGGRAQGRDPGAARLQRLFVLLRRAGEDPGREAGIATYAYDQRGFGATPYRGLWAGEDRMIEDLRVAAALLRARYPATAALSAGREHGRLRS